VGHKKRTQNVPWIIGPLGPQYLLRGNHSRFSSKTTAQNNLKLQKGKQGL